MRSDPYQQENLRQGAFHYLIGRGAAGAAGFFTILLLVRFMDVSNYAAYTAISGLISICGLFAGLGLERAISRYVPEARMYCSVRELSIFIWITGAIRLVAALFIVFTLYACWPAVGRFLAITDFNKYPIGLACLILAETMFQHLSSVLQSLVMQKTLTRLLVVQWAGRLVLIAAVLLAKSSIEWRDSMWIFAIPEIIGVLGFILAVNLHLRKLNKESHISSAARWPQWNNVVKTAIHNLSFDLMAAPPQGYFMKVLTAAYLPVDVSAAYGFFLAMAERARQYIPLHFFYGLLEPAMIANYLKDRNFNNLTYRCQLLYKSNLLLMIPAIAWVSVAGDQIVGLMTGGKFEGMWWILVLVMTQLTLGSHVILLQLILNTVEKSTFLIRGSMVALPIMMISIAAFLVTEPIYLLISPIIFSLVMNSYIVFRLKSSAFPYNPSWSLMKGILYSGLFAFAFVLTAMHFLSLKNNPAVYALCTLFGVIFVYGLLLYAVEAIDKSEIMLLKLLITPNKKLSEKLDTA